MVARTDATDVEERIRRVKAFAATGADVVLADGVENLSVIRRIKQEVDRPIMFNQIAGGKSPVCSLGELRDAGVSLVNYSTPCLFAAQAALENAMKSLKKHDGQLLNEGTEFVGVSACTAVLNQNLERRDSRA